MEACENSLRINAYHDGELPPADATRLEEHLRQCPACRLELQRLRAMSRWLASASPPEVPAEAIGRLRGSIQPARDRMILRTAKALAAVAAAILLTCSAMLWQRFQTPAAPQSIIEPWETVAVAPNSTDAAEDADQTEADVDIQLARSMLEILDTEDGYDNE